MTKINGIIARNNEHNVIYKLPKLQKVKVLIESSKISKHASTIRDLAAAIDELAS
mgnify:CR=1 FL=1